LDNPADAEAMPLKPAREWSLEEAAGAPYDLQELAGPFLAGRAMVAYRSLSEGWLTGGAVHALTLAKNGVPQVMRGDQVAPRRTLTCVDRDSGKFAHAWAKQACGR
jgi:hypothetical protein